MESLWYWIVSLVVGYLLGSIPVGFLVVRWRRRVDLRQVGSGRIGGTNVMRAAGRKVALLCGAGDMFKAALAVFLARWLDGSPLLLALVGVAAVVGHNYSVFLRFRGGAGTAASMGGAIALWPWNMVILPPALLVMSLVTRHTSLGSIAVALLLPIIFVVRASLGIGPWAFVVHGLLTSLLTLWALRPNIHRLLRGEERQLRWERVGGRGSAGRATPDTTNRLGST